MFLLSVSSFIFRNHGDDARPQRTYRSNVDWYSSSLHSCCYICHFIKVIIHQYDDLFLNFLQFSLNRYQSSEPDSEDSILLKKKIDPNIKQSLFKQLFFPAKYSKQIRESNLIQTLLFLIGKLSRNNININLYFLLWKTKSDRFGIDLSIACARREYSFQKHLCYDRTRCFSSNRCHSNIHFISTTPGHKDNHF